MASAQQWINSTSTGLASPFLTSVLDFLSGHHESTYTFFYPDSATKRLLDHPCVFKGWKEFQSSDCSSGSRRFDRTISYQASWANFLQDVNSWFGLRSDISNLLNLDVGYQVLGSFSGHALVTIDCEHCERHLEMTLYNDFTWQSLTRNPFTRSPMTTLSDSVLPPLRTIFEYDVTEKIK